MEEQRDPLLSLRAIIWRAAQQFDAAGGVGYQPGLAEAGDVIPVAGFVHSVHKCFHSAAILREGVRQRRG